MLDQTIYQTLEEWQGENPDRDITQADLIRIAGVTYAKRQRGEPDESTPKQPE